MWSDIRKPGAIDIKQMKSGTAGPKSLVDGPANALRAAADERGWIADERGQQNTSHAV